MFLEASLTRLPHSQPCCINFRRMRPPTWHWRCSQNWFFNMALPAAVLAMEGSVKTLLITEQWTLLDGFFLCLRTFMGWKKLEPVQAKENQQIRMLAHNNCPAFKRALHFVKLIRQLFPQIGTVAWEHQWKDESHHIDLDINCWCTTSIGHESLVGQRCEDNREEGGCECNDNREEGGCKCRVASPAERGFESGNQSQSCAGSPLSLCHNLERNNASLEHKRKG